MSWLRCSVPTLVALCASHAVGFSSVLGAGEEAKFVNLLGDTLFPEGILVRESTGDIFIGGFGDGSIQVIEDGGQRVRFLSEPGQNNLSIAVGIALDETKDRLWVVNFNFDIGGGIPGSNMKLFRLSDERLLATIPEEPIPGVFLNEVAIDSAGNIYMSNTFGPEVFTISASLDNEIQVFASSPLLVNPVQAFGQNGLAITPDQRFLIVSVMDRLDAGNGTLVKIDIATKEVSPIRLTGAVDAFAGSDGMFFFDSYMFMVNVFSQAGAIITASFDDAYDTAHLVIRDAFQSVYDRPTASDVREGRLWTVNSQLDHRIDDQNGALNTPHDVPFQVVHVPLDVLLG